MDWSLVLASQGIEHIIDRSEEGATWELLVAARDSEQALKAIRLYHAENRHWPWHRKLFESDLFFDWASLSWAILLCIFYWLEASQPAFRTSGEMDSSAVTHGQWWRLFTAVWLHSDLSHLASNAVFGVIFLGLSMGRYGTGVGLLTAYIAGFCGNLFAWLIAPQPRFSLGASGMVMGALGLLAVQSLVLWRRDPQARKYILSGILGGVMLFLLLGLSPGSDLLAHAGGFVSGLLLGVILVRLSDLRKKTGVHIFCGFLFAFLTIWPWWLALRSGR